jgi:hypothetical protein
VTFTVTTDGETFATTDLIDVAGSTPALLWDNEIAVRLAWHTPLEGAAYSAPVRLSAHITEVELLKVPAAVAIPPTAVAPTTTPASTFPAVLLIFNIASPVSNMTS